MKLDIFYRIALFCALFCMQSLSFALPVGLEESRKLQIGSSLGETKVDNDVFNLSEPVSNDLESKDRGVFSNSEANNVDQFNKPNRFLDDLKQNNELKQVEFELLKGNIEQTNQNVKQQKNDKLRESGSGTGLYFLVEPLANDPEVREKAKEILEMTKGVRELLSSSEKPEMIDVKQEQYRHRKEGASQQQKEIRNESVSGQAIYYSTNTVYGDSDYEELYENIKWTIIYLIIGIIILKILIKIFTVSSSGNKKYKRRLRN